KSTFPPTPGTAKVVHLPPIPASAIPGCGYRRDHLRALAPRVEVADREVRFMGLKRHLLRILAAASSVKTAADGVPGSV
ncbi:MAG: hypothetical protein ACRECZ_04610, partial [Methylocella sp.]